MIRSAALVLAGGLLAAAPMSAQAQSAGARTDVGDCGMARGASPKTGRVAELPVAVREQLLSLTQGIADAGQSYNTTGLPMRDRPGRRLIEAGRTGRYWFVLYERGGQETVIQGAVFALGTDPGSSQPQALPIINLQGTSAAKVCKAMDDLMAAGITSAPAW